MLTCAVRLIATINGQKETQELFIGKETQDEVIHDAFALCAMIYPEATKRNVQIRLATDEEITMLQEREHTFKRSQQEYQRKYDTSLQPRLFE